jgi:hypothetical protein
VGMLLWGGMKMSESSHESLAGGAVAPDRKPGPGPVCVWLVMLTLVLAACEGDAAPGGVSGTGVAEFCKAVEDLASADWEMVDSFPWDPFPRAVSDWSEALERMRAVADGDSELAGVLDALLPELGAPQESCGLAAPRVG